MEDDPGDVACGLEQANARVEMGHRLLRLIEVEQNLIFLGGLAGLLV